MVTHRRPPSVWGAVVGSVISKMVGVCESLYWWRWSNTQLSGGNPQKPPPPPPSLFGVLSSLMLGSNPRTISCWFPVGISKLEVGARMYHCSFINLDYMFADTPSCF